MNSKLLSILTAFALALVAAAPALAQSTAFTYQGYLNRTGTPASGLHDLRFSLFNASTGGAQVGTTQCLNNITVTDGLFTVQIDFGQRYATTAERHLQIDVRRDTGVGCNNNSGYTTLSPRQQLTATPLASHAKAAFALDAPDGSPLNAVFVDNGGLVGIGTTAPTHSVHIANAGPTLALQDTDSTTSQVGYVSYRDSGNVERAWVGYGTAGIPHFSIVNARPGGNIELLPFTGNVGIGTSTPIAKLEVHGDIRLGSSGQFRATAGEESLRIIRGTVETHFFDGCSAIPTIIAGGGFSVDRSACGRYRITFTTPFAGTPTVTGAGIENISAGCPNYVTTSQVSSSGVSIGVQCDRDGPGGAAWPFSFIAIGPR